MYLAELRLKNWRSYRDTTFRFRPPDNSKRLTLVGAMNGAGKTSLLTALYLGMFGRHGLHFVEGLQKDEGGNYYNKEICKFRHRHSSTEEPMIVEIAFDQTAEDESNEDVFRVKRTWHFQPDGSLRQGDGKEEVQFYLEGQPVRANDLEEAHKTIEQQMFPVDLAPAFFFDGEQAQRMIFEGGSKQFQREVEVLFGTASVNESVANVQSWSSRVTQSMGGKKEVDERRQRLATLEKERDDLDQRLRQVENYSKKKTDERERIETDIRSHNDNLRNLGAHGRSISDLQEKAQNARERLGRAESQLTDMADQLNLAMAIGRFKEPMERRLKAETILEKWLNVKDETQDKTGGVVEKAVPSPRNEDVLLESLSDEQWEKLRQRVRDAVQIIYQPPPEGCADEFLFGFVQGETRNRLAGRLDQAAGLGTQALRRAADEVAEAKRHKDDAERDYERQAGSGEEVERLREEVSKLTRDQESVIKEVGRLDNEYRTLEGQREDKNKEVQRLASEIENAGPDEQRVAIAERAAAALRELSEKVRPIALKRLRERITQHFLAIADRRFGEGDIVFEESKPFIALPHGDKQAIETMSGFERRAFGIAYSLALVEATGRNVPLVIDTPLGNADTDYRDRLLKALIGVDVDQIIVLPHDAEVPSHRISELDGKICQTFLVHYDETSRCSRVHADTYFDGVLQGDR